MKKKRVDTKNRKRQYLINIIKRLGIKVEDFMYCLANNSDYEVFVKELSDRMFKQGHSEEDVIQAINKKMMFLLQSR
ncbi:hypothetical protein HN014_22185 (plasmid) [Aquimarina sp. TRL1]|uniref:hypothetical protein n=1 Tax=Aquimarina sp. (strain TRL1) TaxID=2736252 RepID=UPI00158C1925|nr:hypothetical protein [Aquimarina sp. TRL1]QKX07711.1 hypothetical protein HN014_22185 [Aquimarina sp. TRL1]